MDSEDLREEGLSGDSEPSVDLEKLTQRLGSLGFRVDSSNQEALVLSNMTNASGYRGGRRRYAIPVEECSTLAMQLSHDPVQVPDYFGFMTPKLGWFEVALQTIRPRINRMFDPGIRAVKGPDDQSCRHAAGQPMPSVDPASYPRRWGSVAEFSPIHVTDPKVDACIEISWASPYGILQSVPNARYASVEPPLDRFMSTISIKIDMGRAVDEESLLPTSMELVDSFLYELNIRNGVRLTPIALAEYERDRYRPGREIGATVRFPVTSVRREVAELFSFAESARDNSPLAFLSFYQVLEYFFPFAVRRGAIRKIRKEIADPLFVASSDEAILRLLAAAEASTQASEAVQISTLIADAVRPERLAAFFEDPARQKHFAKSGPIAGVEHININNPQKSLAAQVAERIYRIRNRIVHAKDDPKFTDTRVLLPKSREAYALAPDIDLVRLLAIEVITDSQVGS